MEGKCLRKHAKCHLFFLHIVAPFGSFIQEILTTSWGGSEDLAILTSFARTCTPVRHKYAGKSILAPASAAGGILMALDNSRISSPPFPMSSSKPWKFSEMFSSDILSVPNIQFHMGLVTFLPIESRMSSSNTLRVSSTFFQGLCNNLQK
jgi:hypothetical protein